MKTYLVEIKVEVTHRVLVRAGNSENAEMKAIDQIEDQYDDFRLLTANAEERPTISAKRYREITRS
jgi:hypothetical protein